MTNRYCIVLPAETPIFTHVKFAAWKYFEEFDCADVELIALSQTNSHGPNDHSVINAVVGRSISHDDQSYVVLGGICDPFATKGDANLHLIAAIVKKLAVVLACPATLHITANALKDISHISVDGHKNTKNPVTGKDRFSNSAWALANNIQKFALAYFPKDRSNGVNSNFYYDEHTHDYGSCPVRGTNGEQMRLVITSDLFAAIDKEADQDRRFGAQIYSIQNLFPEWANMLLSALITHKVTLARHETKLRQVVAAISKACTTLHSMPKDEVIQDLVTLYPDKCDEKKAERLYELLFTEEFIPKDLRLSDYGLLLNDALWQGYLSNCVLFSEFRYASFLQNDCRPSSMGEKYPNINNTLLT